MTQKRSHSNKTNSVFLSGDTDTPFQGWEVVSWFNVLSWYFNSLSRIWSLLIDVKYQLWPKWSVLVWSSAVKGMWQPLATLSTSAMSLPMKNCQINWLDCVNEAKWSTGSFTCELKQNTSTITEIVTRLLNIIWFFLKFISPFFLPPHFDLHPRQLHLGPILHLDPGQVLAWMS